MMARFCRYLQKVFALGDQIAALHDRRVQPQIPTATIWSSVFAMQAMRLGSLHALEAELAVPKRLDDLVGPRKPSADSIGRVYGQIDPIQQVRLLSRINHRLGRNKVLHSAWPLRFVAVDGHEFFSQ
jgi:hypothetical protein